MAKYAAVSLVAIVVSLYPTTSIAQCTTKAVTCASTSTDVLGPSSSCVIDSFPTQRYVFTGTAGEKLTLIASNSEGNSIGMTLLDSAGEYITSDFDEPAQIVATLPTAGQYFIDVNFGNPHISGSITLEVTCSSGTTPLPTECTYTGTILIGQSISSQLTSADTPCGDARSYAKAYRVPVNAGDAFTVDYSATYPVEIQIAGPDPSGAYRRSAGNSLTTDYVAPASGNVTIFVYSNTTTPQTGNFTLALTPITLPGCGRTRAVRH